MDEPRTKPLPRTKPPRLVLGFIVFTALGLAAAAAAILIVVRRADTVQAEQQAVGRARLAAEAALDNELRAADLASPVSRERRQELDRVFRSRVLLEGVTGAMLVGRTGRVTYSTRSGAPSATNAVLSRRALRGSLVSQVRDTPAGPVLRTYVPLSLGRGRIDGVVVLDQSQGAIEAAADRTSWRISAILEGLLVLLCLIGVPPLARASSRLRGHVEELEQMATHDELTQLLNRVGFRRAVDAAMRRAGPTGAIVRADLDGFSAIDDLLGPDQADALLVQVAARLAHDLSDCDVIARIGEDEFAFFVRRGDRVDVALVVESIQRALDQPFDLAESPMHVTATIGAALLPEHGSDIATVLRHSGSALVVAKEEGQGVVEIYDEHHETSEVSRLALAAELRKALEDGDLCLYYQPLVDVTTRSVRGAEGLLRWQHQRHGLLAANAFIEQAERSGINRELRRFVLESAGHQWREWAALGLELEIAVNLAKIDLLDASLADELEDVLRRYEMPPWRLLLEITERALEGDVLRVGRTLNRLHEVGVRIAIDDFGTGYSSLSYLERLPVEVLKIDRSFTAAIGHGRDVPVLVRSIVKLGQTLHMEVLAEGIETVEQLTKLRAIDCRLGQGFYFSPALPAAEVIELLEHGWPSQMTA
jgi:diguanylate cyclase (GGDEF)-like protein